MPDIESLDELTINDKTIGRQLAPGNHTDKRQRTASVKEQFKQKVGSLRVMHTIGRMLMCKNNAMQTMQWAPLRAVQTEGSILMCKNNTMLTMWISQLLIPIQWPWVKSTIGIKAYFQI